MVQIVVQPEQLDQEATGFKNKSQEVLQLKQQARTTVNNLQSAWKGNRANKFYSEYQTIEQRVEAAIQTLQEASKLLSDAAAAFRQADQS